MPSIRPRYSKEEFARRGDEIYEREIHPSLETERKSRYPKSYLYLTR